MLEAAAAVELRVENISREDCRKLEDILSTWAQWRKDQPAQADDFQAQLMHGSFRLDVARLINDGMLTWQDTLHPARPRHAGAAELVEEPRYERGTGELLAPALVDNTLLLPGGAAAARRRQLAQASVGAWVDGGAYEAPADTPQPKRRRVGMNKCHNCGSYKHSMNRCPAPFDQKCVNAAMAESRAERGSAPAMLQLRVRYFDMPGGKVGEQGRAGLPPPGTISNDLAEALGMTSSTAPPPWLSRMVVLGVPPRYAEQNEGGEDGEAAAAEELMVFYPGSDDEADAADADPDTAAAAEAVMDPGGAAAAGGSSSSGDEEEDGFIPFDAAGTASTAEQAVQQQAGGSQGVPVDSVQAEQQQEEQAQHPTPGDGPEGVQAASQQQPPASSAAAVAAGAKQPKWVFPGVNADVPSDSDAWTQAMQNAAWLQGRLA